MGWWDAREEWERGYVCVMTQIFDICETSDTEATQKRHDRSDETTQKGRREVEMVLFCVCWTSLERYDSMNAIWKTRHMRYHEIDVQTQKPCKWHECNGLFRFGLWLDWNCCHYTHVVWRSGGGLRWTKKRVLKYLRTTSYQPSAPGHRRTDSERQPENTVWYLVNFWWTVVKMLSLMVTTVSGADWVGGDQWITMYSAVTICWCTSRAWSCGILRITITVVQACLSTHRFLMAVHSWLSTYDSPLMPVYFTLLLWCSLLSSMLCSCAVYSSALSISLSAVKSVVAHAVAHAVVRRACERTWTYALVHMLKSTFTMLMFMLDRVRERIECRAYERIFTTLMCSYARQRARSPRSCVHMF